MGFITIDSPCVLEFPFFPAGVSPPEVSPNPEACREGPRASSTKVGLPQKRGSLLVCGDWNMTLMFPETVWNFIIPIDELIFSDG